MVTPAELGERIRDRRKAQGLTQKELADRLHVTDKAISRWERGVGYPELSMIEALCDALGTDLATLLSSNESSSRQPDQSDDQKNENPNPMQAISDEYQAMRETYQKKIAKQRKLLAAVLLFVIAAGILCLCPWPRRVHRTLNGRWFAPEASFPVTMEIQGWHLNYLIRPDDRFAGTIQFRTEEGRKYFPDTWKVQFSGRQTAYGYGTASNVIFPLDEASDSLLVLSASYALAESNGFVKQGEYESLQACFSSDFAKCALKDFHYPGYFLAAEDPDIDLEKMLKNWNIFLK